MSSRKELMSPLFSRKYIYTGYMSNTPPATPAPDARPIGGPMRALAFCALVFASFDAQAHDHNANNQQVCFKPTAEQINAIRIHTTRLVISIYDVRAEKTQPTTAKISWDRPDATSETSYLGLYPEGLKGQIPKRFLLPLSANHMAPKSRGLCVIVTFIDSNSIEVKTYATLSLDIHVMQRSSKKE